ncbi:uncharacterized protein LOC107749302 [Sinocyclocheilus rhinocerous]|uniref:uncharacterized protein LOC107749302 n=1 Tax=Sinocyclocheilus rhinocerous TaxID=307959 RepID=UPI0007BADA71|nr:PREDICTED: uncharacterized protein LOC107749302 [Sinocyclocheilus rhinocerous]
MGSLGKITEFFRKNYETGQYAVAINVPKEQCITFDELTFLKGENDVRQSLQESLHIYVGTELIAAGVLGNKHSEDLLMNPPNGSYLTQLLKKKGLDGCVVFYTLNSPCIDNCLSNNEDSILPGLAELKAHTGIKAFAFKHIYQWDQNKNNLPAELGKVAERVPLYRCFYECILCGKPGSSTITKESCRWGNLLSIGVPSRTVVLGDEPEAEAELEGVDVMMPNHSLLGLQDGSSCLDTKVDGAALNEGEKVKLAELLRSFAELFDGHLGHTSIVELMDM